ncbi:MAG: hypothetical protein V2B19_14790 [Pseudomonadota bacterium]
MPRFSRLLIPDQRTVYHVMSGTALDGFPFQDTDKDRIVDMIKRFSLLYFVEVLGFCIMGNHFHILVRMIPDHHFTDDDIKTRFARFFVQNIHFNESHLPHYRTKWFLSLDSGLVEFGVLDETERLRRYRRYVYEAGVVAKPGNSTADVINHE